MIPERKILGGLCVMSSIVDAWPEGFGPELIKKSTLCSSCSRASEIVDGTGCPLRLALVPVIGAPSARVRAKGTGWFGMRAATVHPRAVITEGISGRLGSISVKGPGQNLSASVHAIEGMFWAMMESESILGTKTGSGIPFGRPFASNTRSTAAVLNTSAPSPYTVSVG